jgi:hypothetical protein
LRIANGKTYVGTGIVVVVVVDVLVDDVVDVVVAIDVLVDVVGAIVVVESAQPRRLTPTTTREISLALIPSP